MHLPAVAINHPAPPVAFTCLHYLEAFQLLSGDRINTDGDIGSIPFPSKVVFCNEYGITDLDERRKFYAVMTDIDNAWVAAVRRKRERKNNKEVR